jgi:MinD superfamily P-loop ATPase
MPDTKTHLPTLAVAAGKGGTGKTLIATALAQALAQTDQPVQLLDCDVEEPNAHLLLHPVLQNAEAVEILVPEVNLQRCRRCGRCAEACHAGAIAVIRQAVVTFPELCSGCGACSFVCPFAAITEVPRRVGSVYQGRTEEGIEFVAGELEVGNMKATPITRAVKRRIRTDHISLLDAPPGTACPMQETVEESDYCLLVTEPTPFGLSDLQGAVETCHSLGVPCGVIINRHGSGFDGVEQYCKRAQIPVLLQIPQDREIAAAYSEGRTLLDARPQWGPRLVELYQSVVQMMKGTVSTDA